MQMNNKGFVPVFLLVVGVIFLASWAMSGCHKRTTDMELTTDAGTQFKAHMFKDKSIMNVWVHQGTVWGCYEPTGDTGDMYCGTLAKQEDK